MEKNKNELSPMDKYYESIIEKVNKLIEEKKLDEALDIIEDELSAPYIPRNHEEVLEDIANTIIADKHYFSGIKDYTNLNRELLFSKIVENDKLDSMALLYFFERYSNEISHDEIKEFVNFFKIKNLSNQDKEMLFLTLKTQNIDTNVVYYNNQLKEDFFINTIKTDTYKTIDLYIETEKLIYELTVKEPSLLQFCLNILNLIYFYNFPQIPSFNAKDLSFGIFNYMVFSLQGDKSKINKNTFDYINKIINSMNN